MNVTETLAEGLKHEYKVLIPAQDLQAKYSDKLQKLTQNVRLPGFRPGKVPATLLQKRYGDALRSEVVEEDKVRLALLEHPDLQRLGRSAVAEALPLPGAAWQRR